jgi:hypothetical protein
MDPRSAELSSLSTALEDLTRRITAHAEAANAEKDEDTARELFGVERALDNANRRLAKLARSLGRA